MEQKNAASFALLRIVFGIIWLVDACLKWSPGFLDNLSGYLTGAIQGQPAFISWWINLWLKLVSIDPHFFAVLVAISETFIALALILGLFTRTAIVTGVLLTAIIWTTAEGFGGPYMAGSTDVGTGIIYLILFLALWYGECWRRYSLREFFQKK